MDYKETFAPVSKMTTVQTIVVIVASQNWSLYQTNFNNSFLHGDLKEDIYIQPPHCLFLSPTLDV